MLRPVLIILMALIAAILLPLAFFIEDEEPVVSKCYFGSTATSAATNCISFKRGACHSFDCGGNEMFEKKGCGQCKNQKFPFKCKCLECTTDLCNGDKMPDNPETPDNNSPKDSNNAPNEASLALNGLSPPSLTFLAIIGGVAILLAFGGC